MLALTASILFTVFGFGLGATTDDLLYVVRRPAHLARALVAMFVVMPLMAVMLVRVLDFPRTTEIALLALAIAPVPPLFPNREPKAGGRQALALGLMFTVGILSIVLVPLAVWCLGLYSSRPLAMWPGAIAAVILKSAVVPLLVGLAVRRLFPKVAHRIATPVRIIATVLLAVGVVIVFGANYLAIWDEVGDGSVLAMVVFVSVGLAVGHALGGPDRDGRIDLAICTACRHPMIALAIAAANFPETKLVPTVLLYLIVSVVISLVYATRLRRPMPHPARAN